MTRTSQIAVCLSILLLLPCSTTAAISSTPSRQLQTQATGGTLLPPAAMLNRSGLKTILPSTEDTGSISGLLIPPPELIPALLEIHRLQPRAHPLYSLTLARALYRHSQAQSPGLKKNTQAMTLSTDQRLALAIAMQESSLMPGAIGPTGDLGLFQVHPGTARDYGMDLQRLRWDVDYQVEQFYSLMADKRQMPGCRDRRGWSCWHSVTPELRAKYERAVLRFVPKGVKL